MLRTRQYVMNAAPSAYRSGALAAGTYTTFKMAQFRPDYMLYWEPDERTYDFFDNVASTPNEGVTLRHNTGVVMGMYGGQTEYMKVQNYDREVVKRPGRFWCNPGCPLTGDKSCYP